MASSRRARVRLGSARPRRRCPCGRGGRARASWGRGRPVFWFFKELEEKRKRRLREKEKIAVSLFFSLGSDCLLSNSLFSFSLPFVASLTLMGLITFTRAPASTPSWISLPGPKARTHRERRAREETGAAAVERRGADEDADRAETHCRDAAEANISFLEGSFCFEGREREERRWVL